jgi:choline dehydrogenase-like flavoprotein
MPPTRRRLQVQVCIVGGGPCGLALAAALAAAGRQVLVLERGGRHAGPRSDNAFEEAGFPCGPPEQVRRFALGGSGRIWGRTLAVPDEATFTSPAGDGPAWPLPFERLQPYYQRALGLMQAEPGLSPGPEAADAEVVLRPAWRSPCWFPLAQPLPATAAVLTGHRAVRLQAASGRVQAAEVLTRRGEEAAVTADCFVLAAGAVENAMVLLLSGIGGDLAGRYFAEHPQVLVPVGLRRQQLQRHLPDALFSPPRASWDLGPAVRRRSGLPAASAYLVPYRDPALWSRPGVLAAGTLFHSLYHRDLPPRPLRTLGRTLAALPDVARVARAHSGEAPLALRVTLEAPADPANRVTLSRSTDRLGLPRPRVRWQPGPASAAALERLVGGITRRALREGWDPPDPPADLGWPDRIAPGAHHMGTTRMSLRPDEGVVDIDCRVHGLSNLFVAGTSLFPTCGAANPMLTALALTLRLAEHLGAEGRPPVS